jgi:acetyltransferase-like isoleucine patch superfamily enzyme
MYHIFLFFSKIYTFLIKYSFQSFGNKSIIKPFLNLSHPEYIKIGQDVNIGNSCRITVSTDFCGILTKSKTKTKIKIGNHVDIGNNSFISANNNIEIGNHVIMAPFVFITDHNHGFSNLHKNLHQQPLTENGFVKIEDNVFLGIKCSILKNVIIGAHSVVGANSVVIKDVPPFSIVAGNPAKIIKKLK